MSAPSITIITPTWNRRHLLPRLYQSLIDQGTYVDFVEWIVVDDGSTDGTTEYLARIEQDSPISIRALYQGNSGKCSALNRGTLKATGEWLLVVDSDDYLLPGSIEIVLKLIQQADSSVGMIFGLRHFLEHSNKYFESPEKLAQYGKWIDGQSQFDTAIVLRTELVRSNPYPISDGEKYMAESWLYRQIDKTHNSVFLNEFFIESEYQAGGLSANSLRLRCDSPCNAMTVYADQYSTSLRHVLKLRAATNYWRFRFHAMRLGKRSTRFDVPIVFSVFGLIAFSKDIFFSRGNET